MSSSKDASGGPSEDEKRRDLTGPELKDRLPEIEKDTIDCEKRLVEITTLEQENRRLSSRLQNLNRAVFCILYHAEHPSDPRFVQREILVLNEAMESLKNLEPIK